jgi:hypothetical protein
VVRRFLRIAACLCVSMCLLGCSKDVVWHHEVPSPDGRWSAVAETHQTGGWGSGYGWTTVSLKYLKGDAKDKPFAILQYPSDGSSTKAYVLSNENADVFLTIHWTDGNHLELIYTGGTEPDLEVAKYATVNINIQLRDTLSRK